MVYSNSDNNNNNNNNNKSSSKTKKWKIHYNYTPFCYNNYTIVGPRLSWAKTIYYKYKYIVLAQLSAALL